MNTGRNCTGYHEGLLLQTGSHEGYFLPAFRCQRRCIQIGGQGRIRIYIFSSVTINWFDANLDYMPKVRQVRIELTSSFSGFSIYSYSFRRRGWYWRKIYSSLYFGFLCMNISSFPNLVTLCVFNQSTTEIQIFSFFNTIRFKLITSH